MNQYLPPKWTKYKRLNDGSGKKVMREASLRDNQIVYHYLPWKYAKLIFENSRLRLSPVDSWVDPYEKSWCEVLFEGQNKLAGVRVYGLCWTKSKFDEPAWRMAGFEREPPIVRIACHVKDLLEAGSNLIDAEAGSLYFGKVRYVREKLLRGFARAVLKNEVKDVSSAAAGLLLQKRNAFRFEKEARLLWFDRAGRRGEQYLPIATEKVIHQVMMSPYATKQHRAKVSQHLKEFGIRPAASGILWSPEFRKNE